LPAVEPDPKEVQGNAIPGFLYVLEVYGQRFWSLRQYWRRARDRTYAGQSTRSACEPRPFKFRPHSLFRPELRLEVASFFSNWQISGFVSAFFNLFNQVNLANPISNVSAPHLL